MKHLLFVAVTLATLMVTTVACDDDKSPLGSSLVKDQVEIVIDSAFTLKGHSIESREVQARTILQLIGRMSADNYGSFSSSVVTQFMPTENLVTEGVTESTVDSVKMIMRAPLGAYVGDSLSIMGITAYPLVKQLPAGINSAFNPDGYYDTANPLASVMYTMTGAVNDTTVSFPSHLITLDLGKEFGQRLLRQYNESPSTFATPGAFASWFPGIYLTTTFGNGRVAQIDSTVITMYYRQILPIGTSSNPRDTTIYRSNSYLAVTPEVLTNNNMSFDIARSLTDRVNAGEPILAAPTGYDVDLTFPASEIASRYKAQGTDLTVVNSLKLTIPVEEITNNYGITPPPYVLMVKKSKKNEFFAKSLLPDNITSFYAAYDSYRRCYTFTDMRDYILDILDKDQITAEDEEFTICPVTIGFEKVNQNTSSYYYYYYYYGTSSATETTTVASVTPYVNRPSMAKLDLGNAKITFTYSVQNLNF